MGVDQHRGHLAGVAQAGAGSGDDSGGSVAVASATGALWVLSRLVLALPPA